MKEMSSRNMPLLTDLHVLSATITQIIEMVDRVQAYVSRVLSAAEDVNSPQVKAIGRYLMDTVAAMPRLDAKQLETMFNTHLQDVLMIVYLGNAVRAQVDVAQRLGMAAPAATVAT